MIDRKTPIWTLLLIVGAIIFVFVVFRVIVSGTPEETWERIGYPGAFLLGLIGASSIIIPIPHTLALLAIGAIPGFNLTILALLAGFGAAMGELVGYGVGYAGRRVLGKKHERRFKTFARLFERLGPLTSLAIFVFALTPLPDDLLFIPLGLSRYSLWKAFIPAVFGKFLMSWIIIHVGSAVGGVFAGEDVIFAVATTVMLVLIIIAIFKIDWEKMIEKYLPERSGRPRKTLKHEKG